MNSFRAAAWVAMALAATVVVGGCGGDASFDVKYASDYAPGRATVSMFGIYRDGRLSPESWDQFGARLSASLHGTSCEIAYGENLRAANPALFTSLDDYARANGVTDELFEQVASTAKGDLLMIVQMYGRPSKTAGRRHPIPKRLLAQMGGGMGGMGGSGRGMPGGSQHPMPSKPDKPESGPLELTAVLYSVRLHHVVAQVSLKYTGSSVDDAFRRFDEKLEASFPGTSCGGWNWDAMRGVSPRAPGESPATAPVDPREGL
jgi:hypothetical protein